jgi:hypothetical protein
MKRAASKLWAYLPKYPQGVGWQFQEAVDEDNACLKLSIARDELPHAYFVVAAIQPKYAPDERDHRTPAQFAPNAAQLADVAAWRHNNGRTWKSKLLHAWKTDGQGVRGYTNELHRLRNTFGPEWLKKQRREVWRGGSRKAEGGCRSGNLYRVSTINRKASACA